MQNQKKSITFSEENGTNAKVKNYAAIDIKDQRTSSFRTPEEILEEVDLGTYLGIRSAMLGLFTYLFIGVISFSFVFEKWSIADSFYYSVVTFTTIGYGDLTPETQTGKLFCCFFALFGVTYIAMCFVRLGTGYVHAQVDTVSSMEEEILHALVSDEEIPEAMMKHKSPITLTFIINIVLMIFFAHLIKGAEDWTFIDTLYFFVISATTIGYGDFTPTKNHVLGGIFLLYAVATLGYFLSTVCDSVMSTNRSKVLSRFTERKLQYKDIAKADKDKNGKISRNEYIEFMLVSMNIVDQGLIDELHERYDEMLVRETGALTKNDALLWSKERVKSVKSLYHLDA